MIAAIWRPCWVCREIWLFEEKSQMGRHGHAQRYNRETVSLQLGAYSNRNGNASGISEGRAPLFDRSLMASLDSPCPPEDHPIPVTTILKET